MDELPTLPVRLLADTIRAKLGLFPSPLDRNASHQVDWGDFYLVVRVGSSMFLCFLCILGFGRRGASFHWEPLFQKVRDIYGAESVQTEYAKKTLAALWEGLCKLADADEDQLISIDEWINLLRKSTQKERKWFDEYERFMFKLFDVSCKLGCKYAGFVLKLHYRSLRKHYDEGFMDNFGVLSEIPAFWKAPILF
ncbi:hypothetical protein OESDEN_07899 [Oesophagostomum dentatum]|uniref:EF-hand domain-containing protein n=1 Tax=Oesophagostomum dentatum TaxID=61180 RepID=A0A0B1T7W5_OESDE|nr:hypothetical protein OESDEN_07899 [Oesophagostomum dentatum]